MKTRILSFQLTVALLALGLLLGSAAVAGQAVETWTFQGYAVGSTPGNESIEVYMPDVIRLDSGIYRMYYGAGNPTAGWKIKYAESPDAVTWTVKGTVLEGSTDQNNREYDIRGPSVVRLPDGRYRMYYQSGPRFTGPPSQPAFHVRSAISTDGGVTFSREGVRIEIFSADPASPLTIAGHGTFFIAGDGSYVGLFSGNLKDGDPASDIIKATSTDGLNFPYANISKVYDDWHDPIVLNVSGIYKMYATYLMDSTGVAVSTDGLTWPPEMSTMSFVDSQGTVLTEENSGVADIGGVVLTSGQVALYTNYGNPSNDIARFALTATSTPTQSPSPTPTSTSTPQLFDVTVTPTGTGQGSVYSEPGGISCPSTCSASFVNGAQVTLTATADADSTFGGWSGEECSGTGTCFFTVNGPRTVTADFALDTHALSVSNAGSGSGSVTSDPAGISCGGTCSAAYDHGTTVTLTATPEASSTFAGWSGDCSGTGACSVSITAARSVSATFTVKTFALSVSRKGSGTVKSSPAGISCGSKCKKSYAYGTRVTLSAKAARGWRFAGWSGACSGTKTCRVTMTRARSVGARFRR